jgi:hypothetical protein
MRWGSYCPSQHHDDVGAPVERVEVARLLVAAVPDVVRVPDDPQAEPLGDLQRLVGGVVVHEQDLVDPLGRDRPDRRLQRRRGVARRHDDRDLLARTFAHLRAST